MSAIISLFASVSSLHEREVVGRCVGVDRLGFGVIVVEEVCVAGIEQKRREKVPFATQLRVLCLCLNDATERNVLTEFATTRNERRKKSS